MNNQPMGSDSQLPGQLY